MEFIYKTNTYTRLFLKIFSIEKGNGLSPLMVEMNYMKYLCTTVIDLSKRPQKDLCDPLPIIGTVIHIIMVTRM